MTEPTVRNASIRFENFDSASAFAFLDQHIEGVGLLGNLFLECDFLFFVGTRFQPRFERFYVFEHFHFFGYKVATLKDRVGHSEILGCFKVSFEIDWLAFAREVIKFPSFDGSFDLLVDKLLN
jgi:hypothetical protein